MAPSVPLQALVQLNKGPASRIGPDRMRLLAAIATHGSISEAAKAMDLSYKGAWDAVQALNNLFNQPLVLAHSGGRTGGAASVTAAGHSVLAAYGALEAGLARAVDQLELALAASGETLAPLMWSFGMKTSARNALRGVVESITDGAVNAEVRLKISDSVTIIAVITREAVADLELAPGRPAVALIKSSFVILAPGEAALRTSARNALIGTVIRHERGAVNDEIVLELDAGKTITATITRQSAEDLAIAVGQRCQALIKASHVIIAVD